MTKKENFHVIIDVLNEAQSQGIELEEGYSYEELRDMVYNEILNIEKKAQKAKERAAEKKEKGDDLRDKVLELVPRDSTISVDDIVNALSETEENITRNKVINRLTQLGEKGTNQITKEETVGDRKNRITVYRRID